MARSNFPGASSWTRLKLGAVILAVVGVAGVVGYRLAGWSLLDAIYMVVITVFGVGYGEVRPMTPEVRIFTIGLIVSGCSALIYIMGGLFQLITEGELNRALGRRRMTKYIGKLERHVIICGFGRIGRVLAEALRADGVDCVVVDQDMQRLERAAAAGAHVFEGDATLETTLEAAGIARARTLASVLPSDALNVFIALTARNLNPRLQIIARGEDPSAEPKLLQAGADRVVLPTAIGADQIAQLILHPDVGDLFDDGVQAQVMRSLRGFGTRFYASTVPAEVTHAPRIDELERAAGGGFVVVAIRTKSGEIVHGPGHAHTLAPGDELLVLSRSDRPPNLLGALSAKREGRKLSYRGVRLRHIS